MSLNQPKLNTKEEVHLQPGNVREQIAAMPEETVQRIVKQASDYADYLKYTSLMNGISEEMREIPHLKSEVANPKDTTPLIKVEFPDEGGVLTWMEKYSHPFRGYPHHEFVERIDHIKKINRSFLSGLYHEIKSGSKLKLLAILPSLFLLKSALRAWIRSFYRFIERFRIKPLRHCQFVRALHQGFSVVPPGEKPRETEMRFMLRDLVCMVLEFDNAYRFRAQDVLADIDKEHLRKHPVRELIRLLKILSSREKTQEIRDTWKLIRALVSFYLVFDRKLLKIIQTSLLALDSDKAKFTIEDKIFCLPRKDYNFDFVTNPKPEDEKIIKLSALDNEYNKKFQDIRDESTKEHKVEIDNGNTNEVLTKLDEKYDSLMKQAIKQYDQEKERLLNPVIAPL